MMLVLVRKRRFISASLLGALTGRSIRTKEQPYQTHLMKHSTEYRTYRQRRTQTQIARLEFGEEFLNLDIHLRMVVVCSCFPLN